MNYEFGIMSCCLRNWEFMNYELGIKKSGAFVT